MTRCYAKTPTSTVAAVRIVILMAMVMMLASCGTADPSPRSLDGGGCADAVAAKAIMNADGSFAFDVTVLSADTGWDKYAEGWEVVAPDGTVLGTRVLQHPHVDEQPFTRSLDGVVVPDDVGTVTVRVRDSVEGFCGTEIEIEVTR